MTATRSSYARAASVFILVAIAGGVAAAGCNNLSLGTQQTRGNTLVPLDTAPSPTPAPPWAAAYAALTTDAARNAFLADSVAKYGRSLVYDTDDGAGDEQRILIGQFPTAHLGPRARIEPQVGTYRLNDSTTLRPGRVIARLINLSADSVYAPLALQPSDTVYWWMEYRGTRWVSAFVRSKADSGRFVDNVQLTPHPPNKWKQALARWVWSDSSVALWGTCSSYTCCRPTAAAVEASVSLK